MNSEVDVVISPSADYQTDEEEFDEDDLITTQFPTDVLDEIEIDAFQDENENDEGDNIPLSPSEHQNEPQWTQIDFTNLKFLC